MKTPPQRPAVSPLLNRLLLGFARSRELSTQPAAEIVEAAKRFGQSDDITVVAITRNAAVSVAA